MKEVNKFYLNIEGFAPTGEHGRRLRAATSADTIKVLASFIVSIPGLKKALWAAVAAETYDDNDSSDDGRGGEEPLNPCCVEATKMAEENAAGFIKKHMDQIAVPLYSLLNLTERKYQDLVDYWGNSFDENGKKHPFFLPLETKLPTWMSKNKLLSEQRNFMQSSGLVMCQDKKTAYLDPRAVLKRRLKYLHKRGFIDLFDGHDILFRSWGMLHVYGNR